MRRIAIDEGRAACLYREGLSYREVGERLGANLHTVRNRLLAIPGFKARPGSPRRKHHIVVDYFDNIDTETKAYLLGFLYADGYNHEPVHIALDLCDKGPVILFRNELCPAKTLKLMTRLTKKGRPVYCCRIKCADLSRALAKQGMVQKKSLVLEFPACVPPRLCAPFIRGYFDGDGSISNSKAMRSNYLRWTFSLVGTKQFLTVVQGILKKEVEVKSTVRPMKSVFNLYVRGNQQIARVRDWLYTDDGPALQRKRDKFAQILAGR